MPAHKRSKKRYSRKHAKTRTGKGRRAKSKRLAKKMKGGEGNGTKAFQLTDNPNTLGSKKLKGMGFTNQIVDKNAAFIGEKPTASPSMWSRFKRRVKNKTMNMTRSRNSEQKTNKNNDSFASFPSNTPNTNAKSRRVIAGVTHI